MDPRRGRPLGSREDPDGVARFAVFTQTHGGVALPLHLLETYDDLRLPGVARDSTLEALGALLRDRERDRDPGESQRNFAFWLHYDDLFELALVALDRRTAACPDDRAALALRAHVLGHLGRPEASLDDARSALQTPIVRPLVWETLAWKAREEACTALGLADEAADAAAAQLDALRKRG